VSFNSVHAQVHNQFNQSAISSRGKPTSRDALLPWPSGALSRRRSPRARWQSRCTPTSLRYFDTVRRWVNHFGPMIAAHLRKRRPKPHATWHLDEVYLKIDGRMLYLWRAVDAEGEVLDVLVQSKRNKHAALKLIRKF
jgi:hypothetical protein